MPIDPNHPRPQRTRPHWRDLGGAWGFAFDDSGVGLVEQWQRREDVFDRVIQVPFPFESPASGINDTGFHPVVWYRRTFEASSAPGHRLLLHFGAVDYRAQVWVNGEAVARPRGGPPSGAPSPPGPRLLLLCGAGASGPRVWAKGGGVPRPGGGHTPFTADITSALADSGPQVVVVRAEDSPSDLRQPRGKQDWQREP